MLKLCNVDIDRSQEIFETIAKYQDKVIQKLKPKKIILFGSFANIDYRNKGSFPHTNFPHHVDSPHVTSANLTDIYAFSELGHNECSGNRTQHVADQYRGYFQ